MDTKLDKSSGTPLYLQIKDKLKQQLSQLADPASARIHSERQLADTYGVSRMTARHALISLSEELELERNEQGTFVASKDNKKLSVIRFVFPHDWAALSNSAFYSNIFSGAEHKSHELKCDIVFSTIDPQQQLLEKINAQDAIVLVGETDRKVIQKFQQTGCHLCLVDCNAGTKNLGWDLVQVDNVQASQIAADAFVNSMHTKCAYIGPHFKNPSFAFKERLKGYGQRLLERGIPFSDDDCFKMGWFDGEDAARPILEQLRDQGYTAVFGSHAHFSVELLQLARNLGIDQEMSFIGFSDDSLAVNSGLNVIDVPESKIGATAIEQLAASFASGWCLKQSAKLPSRYIDRGSVHQL